MRKLISSSVLLAALIASLTSSPAHAVDTRTCAQGGICAVGDVGPGGGVVFYARTLGAFAASHAENLGYCMGPSCFYQNYVAQVNLTSGAVAALSFDYLEAAPATGVVSRFQANAYDGASGTSSDFGLGQTNTSYFMQQFPNDTAANNASYYANTYANNGLTDWFLPSQDELALLAIKHLKNLLGSADPIAGSDFYIWSSTNERVFHKSSNDMYQGYGEDPNNMRDVIPIRAFSSTPAPAPTTSASPEPTTSAAPVVATAAKATTSSKIKFDRSSSVLTKAGKAKLKKLAASVGSDAEISAIVSVGRLDGSTKAQMRALAKLRAKAISKYLKSQISMNQTYKIKIIDEGVKPITSVTAN